MDISHENILNVKRGILVQSCNSKGVMGAGIALDIRKTYPKVYDDYIYFCKIFKKPILGSTIVTHISDELKVLSGIGQKDYGRVPGRRYVSYIAIQKIFEKAYQLGLEYDLPIIFTKIGCGLGGGDWSIVHDIIEKTCPDPVHKTVYIKQ